MEMRAQEDYSERIYSAADHDKAEKEIKDMMEAQYNQGNPQRRTVVIVIVTDRFIIIIVIRTRQQQPTWDMDYMYQQVKKEAQDVKNAEECHQRVRVIVIIIIRKDVTVIIIARTAQKNVGTMDYGESWTKNAAAAYEDDWEEERMKSSLRAQMEKQFASEDSKAGVQKSRVIIIIVTDDFVIIIVIEKKAGYGQINAAAIEKECRERVQGVKDPRDVWYYCKGIAAKYYNMAAPKQRKVIWETFDDEDDYQDEEMHEVATGMGMHQEMMKYANEAGGEEHIKGMVEDYMSKNYKPRVIVIVVINDDFIIIIVVRTSQNPTWNPKDAY